MAAPWLDGRAFLGELYRLASRNSLHTAAPKGLKSTGAADAYCWRRTPVRRSRRRVMLELWFLNGECFKHQARASTVQCTPSARVRALRTDRRWLFSPGSWIKRRQQTRNASTDFWQCIFGLPEFISKCRMRIFEFLTQCLYPECASAPWHFSEIES
jgi:hypothetical protein